jgi:hypothetical protein
MKYHKLLLYLVFSVFGIAAQAQIPKLNSHPGAAPVIFLDFDGHYVSGTSWNYNGPFQCGPANLNADQITRIFNNVAEDYSPFNINVTTDSTKYHAAPVRQRIRVILTVSSSWYGSAGGVAYTGSFTWGDNTPCFVFTELLQNNLKNISEAAAHEAGHTLGLRHQATYDQNCLMTSSYNTGVGSGEASWAPIMGVGYYRNSTTWHQGPGPYGCNNIQSDLSIITSTANGIIYKNDDYGESFQHVNITPFTNKKFTIDGIISTPEDKDLFKFTLSSQRRVKINAVPTATSGNSGTNLDIAIDLYENKNNIRTFNPSATLSVSIDTILPAGTYHLLIDGVGNEFTTEYGSLGPYMIEAEEMDLGLLPLRKLQLNGMIQQDMHKLNWVIDADETITKLDIEVSTDGRNFKTLTTTAHDALSYNYRPASSVPVIYRLKVQFEDGKEYYSNMITLRNLGNHYKPQIIGNVISNGEMRINSPGNYQYAVYNMSGKKLATGKLNNGTNHVQHHQLTSGVYVIKYVNSQEEWSEKFISH